VFCVYLLGAGSTAVIQPGREGAGVDPGT